MVFNLLVLPIHNVLIVIWSNLLLWLFGIRLEVTGSEHLPDKGPGIIVINHESALDIPIAVAAVKKPVRFMAKQELFRIPFFGWLLKLSHHIPIDRENRKKAIASIEKVSKILVRKGIFIIVSPEGTRSHTGRIAAFKKGAFRLAESYDLAVIPMTLMGARYRVPTKSFKVVPGYIKIIINSSVKVSQFKTLEDCIRQVRDLMVNQKEEYERNRAISA